MTEESHHFIDVIGKWCHEHYVNKVPIGGIKLDRTSCLVWSNHVQQFFRSPIKRCTSVRIRFVFGWYPQIVAVNTCYNQAIEG